MDTQEINGSSDEWLFQQVEIYPWHSDAEFQSGLQSILGPNPSPDQAEQLTLRAKCFYFSRKNNIPIDFNAYKTWRSQHAIPILPNGASLTAGASNNSQNASISNEPAPTNDDTDPPAPYPTSFSQIVELITNGEPIPGIKEVPNTVLEGQATQATTAKRKKPWENELRGGEEVTVINP